MEKCSFGDSSPEVSGYRTCSLPRLGTTALYTGVTLVAGGGSSTEAAVFAKGVTVAIAG